IKFLREHDGLTFMEAIEKLAAQANIEIPKTYSKKNNNLKEFSNINSIIKNRFIKNLKSNGIALDYLKKRGITDDLINKFEIGLAIDAWDDVTNILKKDNKLKNGLRIGLLVESKGKIYDRFRNRIMFPIRNASGHTIAFGGRTLSKSDDAKYINSPESEIFYKSSEIYGLYESKQEINKKDQIIIVEGYTDVLALHKNGYSNSVATLGTAFTKLHIIKLLRYSKNIIFCFDGDNAGKKAAWKAMANCLSELRDETNIGFSFIEDGRDPDEIVNEDPKAFKKVIDNPVPLSDFLFDSLLRNLDLKKIEDKTKFTKSIMPLISQIPMGLYKKLLQEKLLTLTNLSTEDLFNNYELKTQKNQHFRAVNDISLSDNLLLSIFLEHPNLFDQFSDKVIKIIEDKNIVKVLKLIPTFKKGNNFYMNKFLETDDEIKELFIKYSTDKIIYKNEDSAKKTIISILNNYEGQDKESQYFAVLQKYSDGVELTEEEKQLLKNFKK
ncbi:MAG: DNA primase, partial [Gammaproteobacteria bacterium]|nr:DNA primase [Gammaproteobacteria bacterium]